MTLKVALHALLIATAPPGKTAFSLEVAADCAADASSCEGAKRSDFYATWVRQESEATGSKRYAANVDAMLAAAERVLCLRPDGTVTCEQTKAQKRWTFIGLVATGAGVATYESGFREDVATGRGKNGKPSDDGGQGRGPGGERCALQIHPTVRNDDALLGNTPEALTACYEQGFRMLVQARNYCAWKAPKVDPLFATVSMYGTGASCNSGNHGKTALRVGLARRMIVRLRAEVKP